MACSHSFHFGCLVKWFGSQADKNLHESCPCCRHEATEHERLPEGEPEGESEADSEESEDEESEEDSDEESDAHLSFHLVSFRNFCIKNSLSESKKNTELYAATRIQAAWRAYLPRMAWVKHKMNVEECKVVRETLLAIMTQETLAKHQTALHKTRMTSSRAEWRNISAIMIQRIWRGYSAGKKAIKLALSKGYKIHWVFKGSYWQRSFLHNSETWYPHDGLPPQSLEFQNHILWTRVQAVWRGYSTRSHKFKKTACEQIWERLGETVD